MKGGRTGKEDSWVEEAKNGLGREGQDGKDTRNNCMEKTKCNREKRMGWEKLGDGGTEKGEGVR